MQAFILKGSARKKIAVSTAALSLLLISATWWPPLSLFLLVAVQLSLALIVARFERTSFLVPILLVQFCSLSFMKLFYFFSQGADSGVLMETQALLWATLLSVAAYATVMRKFNFGTAMPLEQNNTLIGIVGAGIVLVSVLFLKAFPQPTQLGFMLAQVFALTYLCGLNPKQEGWLAPLIHFGLLLFNYVFFLQALSLSFAFFLLLAFSVNALLYRRSDLLPFITAAGLSLVLLQSIKPELRQSIGEKHLRGWTQRHLEASSLLRESLWSQGMDLALVWASVGPTRSAAPSQLVLNTTSLEKSLSRFGDDSLRHVLSATPQRVPYWNFEAISGHTLIWNEFGRRYEILGPEDFQTAVQFNHLAEGYMRWGWAGFVLSALLFGFFAAGAELISRRVSPAFRVPAYFILLLPFISNYDALSLIGNLVGALCLIGMVEASTSYSIEKRAVFAFAALVFMMSAWPSEPDVRKAARIPLNCLQSAEPKECQAAKRVSQGLPFRVWIP